MKNILQEEIFENFALIREINSMNALIIDS